MIDGYVNKTISGRSENSFEMVELSVLGSRVVITKDEDGHLSQMFPNVLTREEVETRIAELGKVVRLDYFTDLETGYDVIRGQVEARGMVHAFCIMCDVLYESLVDAALFGLRHSMIVDGE